MTIQAAFVAANLGLKKVIDQINDEQWEQMVPSDWTRGKDTTLHDLINYHTYDDAWVPDVLAGKTKEEVGAKYDGDLLKDDPKGNYGHYNQLAVAAVEALGEDDLAKTVHLSYGDFTAKEYLEHITSFRGFRIWDIAKFIGVDSTMPDEVIEGLNQYVVPNLPEWRKMGVFKEAIEAPADASAQVKLLALVGKRA